MKQHEYIEGPEALKNFEQFARAILCRPKQFSNRPYMICKARSHRGSSAFQSLMTTAEVVEGDVESHGGFKIRQFLTESIRQAS